MIRNTIEDLVYKLFKNNSSYSSLAQVSNQIDPTQPNCSRALEAASGNATVGVESERKLTIGDIHKLFQNL